MKEPVIILGFGGNAVDFFDVIVSNYEVIGFVDDDEHKQGGIYNSVKVYGRDFLIQNHQTKVISLLGSENTYKTRKEIIQQFNICPYRFANAIHPTAVVGKNVQLGYDVVIMPGVVITSNAIIGNHVFVMANTVIHHDVEIGDYSLIGSNVVVAGHTKVGAHCYLGSGCNIINGIKLGDYTLVGLGSNVLKSVPPYSTVAGNPAKELKHNLL